jgi:hypothetical protein
MAVPVFCMLRTPSLNEISQTLYRRALFFIFIEVINNRKKLNAAAEEEEEFSSA